MFRSHLSTSLGSLSAKWEKDRKLSKNREKTNEKIKKKQQNFTSKAQSLFSEKNNNKVKKTSKKNSFKQTNGLFARKNMEPVPDNK